MFKKDLSWLDDQIEDNFRAGRVLTAQSLQVCKDMIREMEQELVNLRNELRKWRKHKPRPKKEACEP